MLGGGAPIEGSAVSLWEATAGAPKQLATATTAADGGFTLSVPDDRAAGASLYLVARGGKPASGADNPAIALLAVLGPEAPATVIVNEMTTVASVWTNAQFLNGADIQGPPLSLKIAAGNVPNFVDLATGGWGGPIQDPLNGPQTPTMANFATLADVLSGCVTAVKPDACDQLFAAATAPDGTVPTDTLGGGAAHRAQLVVQARAAVRAARGVLRDPAGQDDARRALHALSGLRAERLGAAAEVRRRRLSRGRQGDVRQRGQSLGRRQLHHRLAGAGHALAGQRH